MSVAELLNILIKLLSNNDLIKYQNTNRFRIKLAEEINKVSLIGIDNWR